MSDTIKSFYLNVVTSEDEVACSDFDYIDDARAYGKWLCDNRECKSYTIERNSGNGLVDGEILESYP